MLILLLSTLAECEPVTSASGGKNGSSIIFITVACSSNYTTQHEKDNVVAQFLLLQQKQNCVGGALQVLFFLAYVRPS